MKDKVYNKGYHEYFSLYFGDVVFMDKQKIKEAVEIFLRAIGENPHREGLKETPDRVVRMCQEIFEGIEKKDVGAMFKTFNSPYSGVVLEKNIPFYSVCEHHLLPFFGRVHVGYVPDGKVVGLSKISRVVDLYSKRLQIQENMGYQIAKALTDELSAKGSIVMIEAEHTCMTMRGVKKIGSKTVTVAKNGIFLENFELEREFFEILGRS